ncbi:expressed unknown protein [Seminavis robusta]|uniref:SCP domain-containing protein n=1 Tax=Seminavis robusta TaxID=568900 RepID=A0A9N8E4X1_9STRA|nr:expressed unknown protein [Seminavis robusta]|eukprot:Sro654_g182130.1 n/a (206) ;mRNA; r:43492-44109
MPSMLKRFRKTSIVRSFTGDSNTFRRLRNRSKYSSSKSSSKKGDDGTTSTMDSSSDEGDHQTIRWERTPSQALRQKRMRDLPSTGAFSSNLILVNRERIHRGKDPLVRCRHLDAIAKKHADEMAQVCEVLESPISSATMAENVQRGPSIRVIHQMIMVGVSDTERNNILSDRFARFGVGTATGEDGMIYMSQLFQETAARRRPTL